MDSTATLLIFMYTLLVY